MATITGSARALAALVATAGAVPALAQGPSFRGMGFLEGADHASAAIAVSSDGNCIVGWCGLDAVRWSGNDMQALGRLSPPFDGLAVGYGTSRDGRAVVGFGRAAQAGTPYWGFIWREGVGIVPIGPAPGPKSLYGSYAAGISDDGNVIVGSSDAELGYPRAFALGPVREWTAITDDPSTASAVSADGRAVVGVVNVDGIDSPFRWSEETGIVLLGDLPGGETGGVAYAVNANGTVVVGGSISGASNPWYAYEAFRWTAETGMVPLGDLPAGDYSSEARAVSASGSVVVGVSSIFPSPRTAAFIWTPQRGMRDLRSVLINDYGLNLAGWELASAQAISADGRTIVGRGINPAGEFEGWVARLERRCRADWNEDGTVTSSDFVAFVDDFLCEGDASTCEGADFNEDGVENSADFFDYIVAFFGVCS